MHKCEDIRWSPCDECGGEGEVDGDPIYNPYPTCPDCNGSGLRFPGLSEECSRLTAKLDDWCDGPYEKKPSVRVFPGEPLKAQAKCLTCGRIASRRHRTYDFDAPHSEECRCQGRGRLPVDTLEAWLDAAESLRGGWAMSKSEKGYYFDYGNIGPAPTEVAVVQWAICKLTGQHTEEADG